MRPLAIGLLLAAGVIIVGWRRPGIGYLVDSSLCHPARPTGHSYRAIASGSSVRTSRLAARGRRSPEPAIVATGIRADCQVILADAHNSRLDLQNIELAKFVFLPVSENGVTEPDGRGTLLRFRQPTELLKSLFTENMGEFSGRKIFQSNRSKDCATKIDERTVLIASELPILRRLIAAGERGPTNEKWVAQWESKAADDAVVLW